MSLSATASTVKPDSPNFSKNQVTSSWRLFGGTVDIVVAPARFNASLTILANLPEALTTRCVLSRGCPRYATRAESSLTVASDILRITTTRSSPNNDIVSAEATALRIADSRSSELGAPASCVSRIVLRLSFVAIDVINSRVISLTLSDTSRGSLPVIRWIVTPLLSHLGVAVTRSHQTRRSISQYSPCLSNLGVRQVPPPTTPSAPQ